MSSLHPFFPARVFPALLSLASHRAQPEGAGPAPSAGRPLAALEEAGGGGTHCALEAAVVVEAAPPAEAAVKSALWTDSAEVEAA